MNFVLKLTVLVVFFSVASSQRKFLQISDIHLDFDYAAGGDALNMCHLSTTNTSKNSASKYGDFRCDSPKMLAQSSILYMKKIEPNPDFILWTGDSSPHWPNDYNRTWEAVYANLKWITRELHEAFPNTLIIPALGNHDSHPADFYEDPEVHPDEAKKIYSGYIEQGSLGDLLRNFPDAKSKFKECGFYSIRQKNYTDENLTQTFIVLNTNLYYNNRANVSEADPCGQLKWLEDELKACKDNERVFIAAHVPPGFFELSPLVPFFNNDNITKRYQEILSDKSAAKKIVAHFYGHLHTDAIRIFTGADGIIQGVGFAAPSVTPLMFEGGVNPSVRVYDYNPTSRVINDYVTHYLPLDQLIGTFDNLDDDVAKSRRKNSKFLSKRDLVDVATTTSDEFESLATDPPTTTPEEDETTKSLTGEEGVTEMSTQKDSVGTELNETSTTTVSPQPSFDPDVEYLVDKWKLGYSKRETLQLNDLSVRSVYKLYTDMRSDSESPAFQSYFHQTWVMHEPKNRLDCNDTCFYSFICAMKYFTRDDFVDCLSEKGGLISTPSVSGGKPTTIRTTTTTSTGSSTRRDPSEFFDTVFDVSEDGTVEKEETDRAQSSLARGIGIGFAFVALIAVAALAFAFYRKTRIRRYRSQEFLLTDSVFRYDGYSQLEIP